MPRWADAAKPAGRRAVKALAAAADVAHRTAPGVVILAYHRVGGGSGLEIDLPTSLFEEQLALLRAEADAVTLDDALTLLATDRPPAGDRVVVTFDDGTVDLLEHALPALVQHAIPATVYVATGHVEDGIEFPAGGRPLSWQALADMVATGLVTVGSHTHRHVVLGNVTAAEAEEELARSQGLIEDRLGTAAAHFAHPKAVAGSAEVEAVVRRRFRSAARSGTRSNPYGGTDLHDLARSPVQTADGMRWFRHKVHGGMALEGRLRALLDRHRYATASR